MKRQFEYLFVAYPGIVPVWKEVSRTTVWCLRELSGKRTDCYLGKRS